MPSGRAPYSAKVKAAPSQLPPVAVPHPDWLPPARTEQEIRWELRKSGKRKTFGRG